MSFSRRSKYLLLTGGTIWEKSRRAPANFNCGTPRNTKKHEGQYVEFICSLSHRSATLYQGWYTNNQLHHNNYHIHHRSSRRTDRVLLPTPSSASDAKFAIPTHVKIWLHASVVVRGRWMGGDTNCMIGIVIDHRIIDHRPPIGLILPPHKPAIASSPAMKSVIWCWQRS